MKERTGEDATLYFYATSAGLRAKISFQIWMFNCSPLTHSKTDSCFEERDCLPRNKILLSTHCRVIPDLYGFLYYITRTSDSHKRWSVCCNRCISSVLAWCDTSGAITPIYLLIFYLFQKFHLHIYSGSVTPANEIKYPRNLGDESQWAREQFARGTVMF